MADAPQADSKSSKRFINYPNVIEGPKTEYKHMHRNNPALSGLPLTVVASL